MNISQSYELSWSTQILESAYEYKINLHNTITLCGFEITNYTKNQNTLGLGLIDSAEAAFYTGTALVNSLAKAFFATCFGDHYSQPTKLLIEASRFGYLFVNSLANIGTLGLLNNFVLSTELQDFIADSDSVSDSESSDNADSLLGNAGSDLDSLPDLDSLSDREGSNKAVQNTTTQPDDLPSTSRTNTCSMSACKVTAIAVSSFFAILMLTVPILLELYPLQRITS